MAQTKPPCDCSGKDRTRLNAGNQHPDFVARLENPAVLKVTIDQPTQTYTGHETKIQYKAGGRIKYLCVDARDVPAFLLLHRGRSPIFRVWKPVAMIVADDSPAPEALDDDAITDDELPDLGTPPTGAVLTLTPEDVFEIMVQWNGIGESSARKLVDAGYSHYSLSELDSEDDSIVDEVSEIAGLGKSLVITAIEEAHKWTADVTEAAE